MAERIALENISAMFREARRQQALNDSVWNDNLGFLNAPEMLTDIERGTSPALCSG